MSSLGRAFAVLRTGALLFRRSPRRIQSRKASWETETGPLYRECPVPSKKLRFDAEFLSASMWFWILWHFWHNPEAVIGHFPWPDASQWTDEELGIPPDDEE
ncbi:NADH dehydrogenase [ubiquinone] 1 beta subcomplex subunit 2, mitochondrial [Austrofundulus limnaeus]|uniref:NADH dehydrogenase [ubiquinone] 1 beta subcomplex subunit 2, mitochondrial n=1 Tax=Austrofundulus limnaeus TaxID=52670 RepID=A0A2I4AW60_AUSLI|nr:PREDICTED: NADH dehydrogenase [ubiquinone] 1 beta subcomplex subunit 2, mitochondrial [Austrofundulus limnaeus]